MTATRKAAAAPDKPETVNKKKRSTTPRRTKKSRANDSRKAATPAKRKRAEVSESRPFAVENAALRAAEVGPVPAAPKVSPPARKQMIAEAAYFKAQSRGFAGGSPERDWFEAEAEVDALLRG